MKLLPTYFNTPSLFNRFTNDPDFGFPSFDRMFHFGDHFGRAASPGPDMDIYEEDNRYHVRMELPGVLKDQLKLEVQNDVLTIEVNQNEQDKAYSHVRQSLKLPRTVDTQSVQAKLEHGVLTVTLTKREEASPRMIEIN